MTGKKVNTNSEEITLKKMRNDETTGSVGTIRFWRAHDPLLCHRELSPFKITGTQAIPSKC